MHPQSNFTLRINEYSPELTFLYRNSKLSRLTATFITAYNPFSQLCDLTANNQAQQKLVMDLSHYHYFPGVGLDPDAQWPGEPSYLVLGLSKKQAKQLGKKYQQNAIIWANHNAVPNLLFL